MSKSFDALKQREELLLCRTYGRYPVSVIRGKGSRLWDADDKEYVDLLAGIAVTALGHCNDEIAACIAEHAHKLVHVSNLFYQEEQLDLAQNILATCHMHKAFFCNSGAEANEAAIKLARRYMQKVRQRDAYEVITLSGCFHGRTLATVSATGQARFQDGFSPIPAGFKQVPWGDLDALRAAIGPQTAAVMAEMVQGEGGIRPMTTEYVQGIEALCREKDILFIADEVQAGLCRTGKFWAFQHFGIQPHILTSAKALANGLPMGAMLAVDDVARGFAVGSHATTFGGGALVSAVANTCLRIMQRDNLADRAARMGQACMEKARQIGQRVPGSIREVRGMGLMIGIDLAEPGAEVWQELLRRGFICNLTHETVLRLLPALTISEADLDAFLKTLEEILRAKKA
ncbi:MAG: aspartate aminotransferase family protein [Desulfovibrionaceae bacterium]